MFVFNKNINKLKFDRLCVVIDIGNPTGISIIRSLGIKNIKVIGFGSKCFSPGRFSKYCYNFIKYDDDDLLTKLINTGENLQKKIPLFATTDKLVIFIEKHREILEKYFTFNWQDKNKFNDIINKNKMIRMAIAAGVDVPKTYFSDSISIDNIIKRLKYPSIIKPSYTNTQDKKAVLVNSVEEFRSAIKDRLFQNGFIVQENIEGSATNIFTSATYTNRKGKLLAIACGNKIRTHPKTFGISTYAKAIHNIEIKRISKKFLNHICYHGIADLEFKKCQKTGNYMFIEINPRVCTLNQLYLSSGINLPHIYYLDFKNRLDETNNCIDNHIDVRFMSIFNDLFGVLKNCPEVTFWHWLKDLYQCTSYEVFSFKDPLPFFVHFLNKVAAVTLKNHHA